MGLFQKRSRRYAPVAGRVVDEKKIKSSGVSGVIRPGKAAVQVVIGPKVPFVYEAFKALVE